jgi:SspJ family small acid-soluble spore protein
VFVIEGALVEVGQGLKKDIATPPGNKKKNRKPQKEK